MKYLLCLLFLCSCFFTYSAQAEKPNVVIIFLDDSGYGDFKPFGNPSYETPNVATLAKEGVRFEQFFVPQAICSASRASLLSGCFPGRTKVFGAHGPNGLGLPTQFATMAEMLKGHGYATAHFGKWHCGDQPETRPLARGFDEHAGLMYSNDMWRFHPGDPVRWGKHPLKYWHNGEVKIQDIDKKDQTQLTKWATDYAVDFINRKKDQPFFVYLAHSMPHVPLFVSKPFEGISGAGLYGDVILEIDWSVGQLMNALKKNNVDKNTVFLFSSDNGPWLDYGKRAGTTPFRNFKASSFEGGTRSATIMKYPAKLKPAVNSKPICSVDMLPTIAHLTGAKLPENEIDGKNVWSMIKHADKEQDEWPHAYYPISVGRSFQAIISGDGRWKLHLPHSYKTIVEPGKGGLPGKRLMKKIELSLFDLKNDPVESKNVISEHPELAEKLKKLALAHQATYYAQSSSKSSSKKKKK